MRIDELIFGFLQVDYHRIHVLNTNYVRKIDLYHLHVKTQLQLANRYTDLCHSHKLLLSSTKSCNSSEIVIDVQSPFHHLTVRRKLLIATTTAFLPLLCRALHP